MPILQLLFLDPLTTANIMKVTAFFYGNGVPVSLEYQLYEACGKMSRTGMKKEVCDVRVLRKCRRWMWIMPIILLQSSL